MANSKRTAHQASVRAKSHLPLLLPKSPGEQNMDARFVPFLGAIMEAPTVLPGAPVFYAVLYGRYATSPPHRILNRLGKHMC